MHETLTGKQVICPKCGGNRFEVFDAREYDKQGRQYLNNVYINCICGWEAGFEE